MGVTLHWIIQDAASLDAVRFLFQEYQAELGIDLCFQGFQEELQSLPGRYAPPTGGLLLVVVDGVPAGCGAFYDMGGWVTELKRIYVRPDFRRRSLGKTITEALLRQAKMAGFQKAKLDTLRRLVAANNLYTSLGFIETTPYNENPESDVTYFELAL